MSSTTTTWTTDTNTKSGSATTYTDTVSSLRLVGGEGEDAILRLFADEGDDNADQWRIVSQASTNKLNFMSFASGAWSNVLNLFGSGTAASQYLSIQTGNKLYLDGGSDTYLQESGGDVLDIYVGGANMIKLTESTTDTVTITGQLTVGVDDTGYDVKFFGATATNGYMLWDESTDDLILGSSSRLGIGTTAPDTLLHVLGTGVNGEITVERASGAEMLFQSQAALGTIGTQSNHDLVLKANSNTAMTIQNDLKVGIGTTAPFQKLEVAESGSTAVIATFREDDDINNTEVLGRLIFSGSHVGAAATRKTGALIAATAAADWAIQELDIISQQIDNFILRMLLMQPVWVLQE